MLRRVAVRLGYRDMSRMVDEIEPDELARWIAVGQLDGWGESWWMTAEICKTIHNTAMIVLARCGKKVDLDDFKSTREFIPRHLRPKKPKVKPQATDAVDTTTGWMKKMAGLNNG